MGHAHDDHREGSARGGQADFDRLYRQWYGPLVRLCRYHLGNHADAEAVAQEAFIRAWASRHRLLDDRPFWPWLATIARRLCANEARSTTRRRARLATLAPLTRNEPPADARLQDFTHSERIEGALQSLPPRQRTELLLRDVEGWSYEEIARFDGVTVESVRGSLKRARAMFREAYRRSARVVVGGTVAVARRALRTSESWAGLAVGRAVGLEPLALAALLLASPAAASEPGLAAVALVAPSTTPVGAPADPVPVKAMTASAPVPPPPVRRATTATSSVADSGPSTPADAYTFTQSPSYADDHTVFALGHSCSNHCTTLMRSSDGGATWTRVADGLPTEISLLLPPAYPRDPRIFVGALQGLLVSSDGGTTFSIIAPVPGLSRALMSPSFSAGDPRILLQASDKVLVYRDDTRAVEILRLPLPVDLLLWSVAFGDRYTGDHTILVSAVSAVDTLSPLWTFTWRHRVFACDDRSCRLVLDYEARDGTTTDFWPGLDAPDGLIVSSGHALHRWNRATAAFEPMPPVGDPSWVNVFLRATADGRLLLVGWPGGSRSPTTYEWHDGEWKPIGYGRLFNDLLVAPDGRMLAVDQSLEGDWTPHFHCSLDGGATWAPTCLPAVPSP